MTGNDLLNQLLELREKNPEALSLPVARADDPGDGPTFHPDQVCVLHTDEDGGYTEEDPGHPESERYLVLAPSAW